MSELGHRMSVPRGERHRQRCAAGLDALDRRGPRDGERVYWTGKRWVPYVRVLWTGTRWIWGDPR